MMGRQSTASTGLAPTVTKALGVQVLLFFILNYFLWCIRKYPTFLVCRNFHVNLDKVCTGNIEGAARYKTIISCLSFMQDL